MKGSDDALKGTMERVLWREDFAKQDPQEFEKFWRALNEEAVSNVPEYRRARIRALVWRIEQERRRHKSPLRAARVLYEMMWEKTVHLGSTGAELPHIIKGEGSDSLRVSSDSVIPFSKTKK